MIRIFSALIALVSLAACAADPNAAPPPIEDFRLGYNIVQARDVIPGPFSRPATEDELTTALSRSLQARLGPYDGDGLYHLGVAIGGYVLALPGVPVIYSPKSILIFDITVYDNATQQKLNEKPKRIIAFEGLQNTIPILGSGLVRSKEEQLNNLVIEGARLTQNWLADNQSWFVAKTGQERVPFDRAAAQQAANAAIADLPPVESTAAPTPQTIPTN